jgi:hypothetical protein
MLSGERLIDKSMAKIGEIPSRGFGLRSKGDSEMKTERDSGAPGLQWPSMEARVT